MRPLSRREALLLGGLGAAGTVAGGAGLIWSLSARPGGTTGSSLVQPEELRSEAGQLQVRLEAAPGQVQLGGRQASALCYNGSVPGPTLRLKPGDTLKVNLVNHLSQATNLHVHGLHVSPEGNGDNVFVAVGPGSAFDYEYTLPKDHPPGLYWYHPHHHGMVADQVYAGLFGAIIVEDPEPIEAGAERLLVVSDTTVDGLGNIAAASAMDRMAGREGELLLVNGQANPQFGAVPGQRERWRFVNACVARYLRLRLDGQNLQLLGMDSGRLQQPRPVDELVLTPGNRADLLVTTVAGSSVLRAFRYNRGSMPGMMGSGFGPQDPAEGIPLASFQVSGEPAAPPAALRPQAVPADLRPAAVAAQRQIILAAGMGMGGGGMMRFTINGREFDPARTDITAAAGTVEEWTLINSSTMDHPFHLHVWPMQVVEENGQAAAAPDWRDVVNLPANGRVKVRVAFADFRGRSAYHCHILDHEDLGMMGAIEVR